MTAPPSSRWKCAEHGRVFKGNRQRDVAPWSSAAQTVAPDKPFRVQVRDLGALQPGPGLDDISGLLERIEGE